MKAGFASFAIIEYTSLFFEVFKSIFASLKGSFPPECSVNIFWVLK